jgi:type II secretory pathway component PulJ
VARAEERGTALIEAIVALAILASAGLATVALLDQAVRDEAELQARERAQVEAGEVLSAMVLLTRRDLDLRIGERQVGEFVVEVLRPEPTLYRIAVAEVSAPGVEMLVTVVHRPELSR